MLFTARMDTKTPEYLAEDISGRLLAICIIFLVLETIFVVLLWTSRYYARQERRESAMEIFMTSTYLVCCGKITVVILLIKLGGTGHHTASLSRSTMSTALKLSAANQILCPLSTSLSKLGVLAFLHRIFARLGRWYRIIIRTTFIIVLLMTVAQFLIPFINCRPFRKTWEPQTRGTCAIESLDLWRYAGVPNVFTTLMVVGIPVPALVGLNVSRGAKYGLGVVLCISLVGVMAAFMRVYSFLKVKDFSDITYENVMPMCWIVAESGIYLIAGVSLTLKPLVRRVCKGTALERLLTRSKTGSERSGGNKKSFNRREYPGPSRVELSDTRDPQSLEEVVEETTVPTRAKSTSAYVMYK